MVRTMYPDTPITLSKRTLVDVHAVEKLFGVDVLERTPLGDILCQDWRKFRVTVWGNNRYQVGAYRVIGYEVDLVFPITRTVHQNDMLGDECNMRWRVLQLQYQ